MSRLMADGGEKRQKYLHEKENERMRIQFKHGITARWQTLFGLLLWACAGMGTPIAAPPDTTATTSETLPWPHSVQTTIDSLLQDPLFQTSQVGIMVYDLTADSVLYRRNERQLLCPASTMKIVTAVAALDRLGGSYLFKTQLKYTGTIADRTLTGDLYCIGGFDPRLNIDDINAFVESIKKMGVDTIRGTVYADMGMKETALLGEGWCWDDDNPVLSPLVFARRDIFMERFLAKMADAGVVIDGTSGINNCPPNAYEICTRFHTIDQILMRMMKESDNLYAEAMFYQIAAATGNRPATASHARSIIHRLIDRLGLNASQYRIADGCGLSLYNYVSAELEVTLLKHAYRNSHIYLHLLPSLPIAGLDGTLKNRMQGTFAHDNVRAKTGTLTGIISLAGYCTAANGHKLCFAIINQGVMQSARARAFQDDVCNTLCAPQ